MTYRELMIYREAMDALPSCERSELCRLVSMASPREREKAQKAARNIAMARRKRQLNAVSDKRLRVLVGARVPREEALAIELAAKRQGVSTYRFIRDTLLQAAAAH